VGISFVLMSNITDHLFFKTFIMKKITLILAFATAIFTSCNNGSDTPKDAVDAAKDNNDKKEDQKTLAVTEDDSKFLVFAADAGMTEVEASKLANTQTVGAKTKEFADMMIKDHSAAGDEVKAIAAAKNVTLPAGISEDHQKALNDLGTKKGTDFEKEYIAMMVDDHQKVVDKFKDAAENCKDTDIKGFAAKTLPGMQAHLDHAKALKDGMKK